MLGLFQLRITRLALEMGRSIPPVRSKLQILYSTWNLPKWHVPTCRRLDLPVAPYSQTQRKRACREERSFTSGPHLQRSPLVLFRCVVVSGRPLGTVCTQRSSKKRKLCTIQEHGLVLNDETCDNVRSFVSRFVIVNSPPFSLLEKEPLIRKAFDCGSWTKVKIHSAHHVSSVVLPKGQCCASRLSILHGRAYPGLNDRCNGCILNPYLNTC